MIPSVLNYLAFKRIKISFPFMVKSKLQKKKDITMGNYSISYRNERDFTM